MNDRTQRLIDVRTLDGRTAPGTAVRLACDFSGGPSEATGELRVEALDLSRVAATAHLRTTVSRAADRVELDLVLPAEAPRGYHLRASWVPDAGEPSTALGAVLVAEHWRDAPRMGFLSEFGEDDARPERIERMAAFHLTVVQFYDWMYRHYRFLPPGDVYEDGMGRTLSLDTIRTRLSTVQRHGMAGLAYGAVYGAEEAYAQDHPDELLRDANGQPHALIERFFITDPRPGPWRERLLDEYAQAVRDLGFDAVHMDQYGAPKHAFAHDGTRVDLAAAFPDLVDAAAARVRAVRPDASVTFNAVNDWPSEAIATTDQAICYVEVWPPHDRYRHLVDIVERARAASDGKQVVLAAYLEPFREGGPRAEAAAFLATAVIAAAGGHHLLLGEGDGVLRDPYYPNHGRLSEAGRARMRRLYDHTAALHHRLFDPGAVDRSRTFANGENPELVLLGAPAASEPTAGHVWTSIREAPNGSLVVHLVNLTHLEDDRWNAPKPEREASIERLELDIGRTFRRPRVTWLDPDDGHGPRQLEPRPGSGGSRYDLPTLTLWATLAIDEHAGDP